MERQGVPDTKNDLVQELGEFVQALALCELQVRTRNWSWVAGKVTKAAKRLDHAVKQFNSDYAFDWGSPTARYFGNSPIWEMDSAVKVEDFVKLREAVGFLMIEVQAARTWREIAEEEAEAEVKTDWFSFWVNATSVVYLLSLLLRFARWCAELTTGFVRSGPQVVQRVVLLLTETAVLATITYCCYRVVSWWFPKKELYDQVMLTVASVAVIVIVGRDFILFKQAED